MHRFSHVTVERLYENQDSNNEPYWVLQLSNGKTVSAFDRSLVAGLEDGMQATIEAKQKGKYLNAVSIQPEMDQRESIERQSAARTAAILLQHKSPSEEEFIEWTNTIHAFIRRDGRRLQS